MKKSVQCAVCLIPPNDVWGSIQTMRERFDPAFERWMPHINLLYPFVPPELVGDILPRLDESLQAVTPFDVEFTEFGTFRHGKSSATLFLQPFPVEPIVEVQRRLVTAFPEHNDLNTRGEHGFSPHLTVAKMRGDSRHMSSITNQCSESFNNIRFTVNEVCVIVRDKDTPFEVIHSCALGKVA